MELINLAGIALLALLIRKLVWCLRWLWCYYHGKETPEPVSFLPRLRRTGRLFRLIVPGILAFLPEGHGHSSSRLSDKCSASAP